MSARLYLSSLLCSGLALVAALPLPAAAAPAPGKAQAAPLIDREKFFGNPEIAGAQLSPDGKWIAFLKPWKETRNVWVKKVGEPYTKGRLITADPKRPIPGFFWSRDSKQILFVQDKDGDENFNVYAVDPAATPAPGKEAAEARNLTAAKGARAMIYSVPKADPDAIYVGLNDRDAAWHDVYKVKISTGERTLLRKNTERIAGWVFDKQASLRLALRTTEKGDTEILRVDPEGFTKVYECGVFESAGPAAFHKDGKRVYLETNKGARDLVELVLFDPATGQETKIESDPQGRVDFGSAIFSEITDELIATTYLDDCTRIYWKDKAWEADYKLLQKKLPGKEISLASTTDDEQVCMISASSDRDPGTRYLFDRRTKKLSLEYVSREDLPREPLVAMQPIRYKSSDGLEIPAYLSLPKGIPAKNLPLVVFPHGGPWARDQWGFNPYAQFLANRGYAVLAPNFRGSTGYGKKFLNAGNKQWGDRMQDDLTWGVKHLVAKGIVDPKRVGIMGGSYGGYATLAGVAFTPDVYAAAVSIVGPSNLLTLLETIPPYWEAGRIVFHERMGNPNTPEGKKQLERQSPLNSVAKIHTPLLVVQGANDPRVKMAESEQIVIALRDRGFPVEYICAPDEGHGFARPVNNQAMMAAAEKFLAKHLKARFQEGGKADVMSRLPEITVDPQDCGPGQEGRCGLRGRAQARGQSRCRDLHLRWHPGHGAPEHAPLHGPHHQGRGWYLGGHRCHQAAGRRCHGHHHPGQRKPGAPQALGEAGPRHHRDGLRGQQGHRLHGHGRGSQALQHRPGRRCLRRWLRGPGCPGLPAPGGWLHGHLPQCGPPAPEGSAQAGQGCGCRGRDGCCWQLQGLEADAHLRRWGSWEHRHVGGFGLPQGAEDRRHPAPDGRGSGHPRAAEVSA